MPPRAGAVEQERALYGLAPRGPAPEPAAPAERDAVALAADERDLAVDDNAAFVAPRARPSGATLETITVYGRPPAAGVAAQQVRVVLGFDAMAAFKRGERRAGEGLPRSVFLDLEGVTPSPALSDLVSVAAGGLERVRAFAIDAHAMRVSFDLADDAAYRLFFLTQPYRVIFDVRRGARRPAVPGALRTIVIDPGHGGKQDGARGPNGLEESVVALSLSQRVKRELQALLPGTRIVLTRVGDTTVTLEERAAIATGVDADLFVSIHLNASPSASDRGGVSTYVLDTSDDVQALRLAARENEAAEHDVTDLQRLFASLYRKDQVAHSLDLAQAIQSSTLASGRRVLPALADRGVKKALFYVLVGATMPAVLCEASFITRPEEATALETDAYRDALAHGIADGIAAYARRQARAKAAEPRAAAPAASAR